MTPAAACALLIGNWCAVCLTGTCELGSGVDARKAVTPLQSPIPGYTITVSTEKRAEIPEESLTVELAEVRDNRCAAEVQCVWAGTAEIALRVSKGGAAPGSVVIGTLAKPQGGGAPAQPTYAGFRFSVVRLEPPNSMVKPPAQAAYRATLNVAKGE
jgi:hypothetical protein